MDWLSSWIIGLDFGNRWTFGVKWESKLVYSAFLNDLTATFRCIVLNDAIAHWKCVVNQISTMKVSVINVTKIHNYICVEFMVMEASVVLQIIGISLNVNILKQFIVLGPILLVYIWFFLLRDVEIFPESLNIVISCFCRFAVFRLIGISIWTL